MIVERIVGDATGACLSAVLFTHTATAHSRFPVMRHLRLGGLLPAGETAADAGFDVGQHHRRATGSNHRPRRTEEEQMTERPVAIEPRTWADSAIDECMTLYDHAVPTWTPHEAVAIYMAPAVFGDGPPLVRYVGPDGSAVIRHGWNIWTGFSAAVVLESPKLMYQERPEPEEGSNHG